MTAFKPIVLRIIVIARPRLAGLWTHAKDGFYHDGRFATIRDVVNHYDSCLSLGLADDEKADLVQYLKSIPANLDAAAQ